MSMSALVILHSSTEVDIRPVKGQSATLHYHSSQTHGPRPRQLLPRNPRTLPIRASRVATLNLIRLPAPPRVREYVNLLEEDATDALTFATQDDFETHIKLESEMREAAKDSSSKKQPN